MTISHLRKFPGAASCSVGPVAISLFLRSPTGTEARESMQILGDVARAHEQIMMLAIISSECGVPDPPVRDALTNEVKRYQKQLSKVANVVEGTGFGAAALRSAVTGLTLLIRPDYPVKTFASVLEAADFLVGGTAIRPRDIHSAYVAMTQNP